MLNIERSPLGTEMDLSELRYAQVWESAGTLRKALESADANLRSCLCITSAGCNLFELLVKKPTLAVTGIDMSPAQIALLELRTQAVRLLEFEDYLALMGWGDGPAPAALYASLRPSLSASSQNYWDARLALLENGLWKSGRLERFFERFRREGLQAALRPETLEKLWECRSLEEQRTLVAVTDWSAFRAVARKFFGNETFARFGRDPRQFLYVEDSDVSHGLLKNFFRILNTSLVRENPYLSRLLYGRLPEAEAFRPVDTVRSSYAILRDRLPSLEIVQSDLEGYLATTERRWGAFFLSDIFEYLSPEQTRGLAERLHARIQPGGLVGYWTLFVKRDLALPGRLELAAETSQRLSNEDPVFFYSEFRCYRNSEATEMGIPC